MTSIGIAAGEAEVEAAPVTRPKQADGLLLGLQKVLQQLQQQTKGRTDHDPIAFVEQCCARLTGMTYDIKMQNDAAEFLSRLTEHCDEALESLELPKWFEGMFAGTVIWHSQGMESDAGRNEVVARDQSQEVFRSILLPVDGQQPVEWAVAEPGCDGRDWDH